MMHAVLVFAPNPATTATWPQARLAASLTPSATKSAMSEASITSSSVRVEPQVG
jgi:hypothetical protein